MTSKPPRIAIIGAGQAGASAAASLRQFGFGGEINLFGEESAVPYQRPPLSKAYLKGDADFETLMIRPRSFYEERGIHLRENLRATFVKADEHVVGFTDGSMKCFDILILATGSRPRRPAVPGIDLPGVHQLRSLADANALRHSLKQGDRVALVGGGYIGLEVAAAVTGMGARAIVFEREERLLARVASTQLSDYFRAYHNRNFVEIVTGSEVAGFKAGPAGRVAAVQIADHSSFACGTVLICVGGEPNEELARDAGLICDRGIVVDIDGRTSNPDIFAIGDATRRPLPLYDDRMHRIESVPNAIEQAKQVASAIMGLPRPPPEVPWFWSDQFGLKLKIAGLSFDPDDTLVRGSPSAHEFSVLHLKHGKLICLESINTTADFIAAKTLIARGTYLKGLPMTNTAIALKTLSA